MESIKPDIFHFLHFSQPTKEQREVLSALEQFVEIQDPRDFLIISGAAGTGKSSLIAALIGYLNHTGMMYHIAAPTGRAARLIGRKSKTEASTIHSLIYKTEIDEKSGKAFWKLKEAPLSSCAIYIIDEASMISKETSTDNGLIQAEKALLYDLIDYVKKGNVNNKIIFLGDTYQLPPVYENKSYALEQNFLEETFNLKGHSYVLTEVKRQKDGSYILDNATEIRKAIDRGEKTHPIKGNRHDSIYTASQHYVMQTKKEGYDDIVAISVSHKANSFFNDLVRNELYGKTKDVLEVGDLLMVCQNWYRSETPLYNGDHVELLDVDWNHCEQVAGLHFIPVRIKLLISESEVIVEDLALLECIASPGGIIDQQLILDLVKERMIKNPIYRETRLPQDDRYVGALRLVYGHAITCHKAQGGEWKKVYINTLGIPSLKWQYTAVTRGVDEIEKFGK